MKQQTIPRGLFYSVAFICLCGCSIANMHAGVDRSSDISTSERGILVGSIGSNSLPGWRSYNIGFRSSDMKVRGSVGFRSEPTSPLDWDEPDWKGRVFSVELPPGQYEFFIMNLGNQGVGFVNTKISLLFQVKRDEAVYVGELKWSQAQYAMRGVIKDSLRPGPASFSVSDQATRDVPIIRERYPEIASRPLRVEVPSADRRAD